MIGTISFDSELPVVGLYVSRLLALFGEFYVVRGALQTLDLQ